MLCVPYKLWCLPHNRDKPICGRTALLVKHVVITSGGSEMKPSEHGRQVPLGKLKMCRTCSF